MAAEPEPQPAAPAEPEPFRLVLPAARRWGAVYTQPRCEKLVAEFLAQRHTPHFLPLIRKRNVSNRSERYFTSPLFSGYVFLDLDALPSREIYESGKVAQLIEAPDPERLRGELANLALALNADETLRVTRYGKAGKPVVVARGRLKGLHGETVRVKGTTRLILRVQFLSQAAWLEIDESFIEAEV
jgi:hypothetical protein